MWKSKSEDERAAVEHDATKRFAAYQFLTLFVAFHRVHVVVDVLGVDVALCFVVLSVDVLVLVLSLHVAVVILVLGVDVLGFVVIGDVVKRTVLMTMMF